MKLFILLIMIFVHILDDFHFQGILANLKQKSYWKKQIQELSDNAENIYCLTELYKKDWLISLIIHAFQWTFIVMLVLVIYNNSLITSPVFYIIFILNIIIHAIVDHLKCNKFYINLVTDQLIHLNQIAITWFLLI